MNTYILSLLVIGILLLVVTLGSRWIAKLPLSYALIYLIVGVSLSPYGLRLVRLRPDANFLEHLTEMVVLISLFGCGLKMNRPLRFWAWNSTARLIGFLMPLSIGGVALTAHWLLGWGWGESFLLGAILSPTDPVLASDVQMNDPDDRDELRFALTSEGGLNDAFAFPFVYFGLRWIENDHWQEWFSQWVLVNLVWEIAAGVGAGLLVARAVLWLSNQAKHFETVDDLTEDFVALSTILVSYSVAILIHGYGFVAVFVAGMVMQSRCPDPLKPLAQLRFIDRVERLAEIAAILILGSLLRIEPILRFGWQSLVIAGMLLLVIRPVGTWVSTIGAPMGKTTRSLLGWFGIRGVGSLYYLSYALGEGLRGAAGEQIAWVTFTTATLSILLYGVTATPLMNWYQHRIDTGRIRTSPVVEKLEEG